MKNPAVLIEHIIFTIPSNLNRVSIEFNLNLNSVNVETVKSVLSTQPNRKNCLPFDFRFDNERSMEKQNKEKEPANSTNWSVNKNKF